MLDLSALGLNGTIPAEFCALMQLTFLRLDRNLLLTGTIPTELGSLTQLSALILVSNSQFDFKLADDAIPTELGALTQLVGFKVQLVDWWDSWVP